MSDRVPAIRVLLLPKDTNAYGTIFGGVILSHIDLASAIEARKIAPHHYVMKAMREVEFHEPVHGAAPGQAAVVYDGDVVVGGGFIA